MNKKVLTLVLAFCLTLSLLAGCSSAPAQQTQAPAAPAAAETAAPAENVEPIAVSLKVWSPSEDQNPDMGAWLNTMCEQFNEAHPEWDITFEYGVCTESEAKKLVPQDIDAAADVFLFSSTGMENLNQASCLAELGGKYLENVKANYPESLVKSVTYEDGGVYGVPMTTNTYFMYYDKSVFTEEDVKSLDTMLEKGKVAYPITDGFYNAAFYIGNGCTFFGEEGTDRASGIQLGGEKGTAVTNALVDLVKNPNFIAAIPSDAIAMMREGNCDAYVCGTWQAAQTQEVLGDYESQKYHYETRGYIPCENQLISEVQDDPICRVDSQTIKEIAMPRSCFAEYSYFWTPAESMGTELRDGAVTHENAAEKTEAFNVAANSSGLN